MLTLLQIRDLGLIDRADLELGAGLTVLTGETGAGKSMLVDALGLLLGDRAEPRMVRRGAAQAEVIGDFDVAAAPAATTWLAAQELTDDGQCLVRRVLAREGRSRAFVNGRPVTMQLLRELGERLADIHGQHDHQSLLRPDAQRRMLDARGHHEALAETVAAAHATWMSAARQAAEFATQREAHGARLELLRFQVAELDTLAPRPDELVALEAEQRRLAAADHLRGATRALADALYDADHGAIHDGLARAGRELATLADHDATLAPLAGTLEEARILVDEVAGELRQRTDDFAGDPERLAAVERRLEQLHATARKYRIAPEALAALHARLRDELGDDDDPATAGARLETAAAEAEAAYRGHAVRLGKSRRAVARKLVAEVDASLGKLGMPGGRFAVEFEALEGDSGSPHGEERVRFMITANPDQPLQPLQQVASGGELSRISLAIQAATAASVAVPTVVYDEVDVGIGGRVAEIVGHLLRDLAADRQVLCITHLPQVAAQGRHHLLVDKRVEDGRTRTTVQQLDERERGAELARMLGGVEITAQTRAHAEEMIARARS